MMALLDKPEGRALHDIMFSLVREYPQALCYSFKISSSSFTFDTSTEEGQSNRAAVEEMTAMLEMRAVDDFVAALEQLTSPELLWKVMNSFLHWYCSLAGALKGHCCVSGADTANASFGCLVPPVVLREALCTLTHLHLYLSMLFLRMYVRVYLLQLLCDL